MQPPKRKYFGTDGIRGPANTGPLTPDYLTRIAQAVSHVCKRGKNIHPTVVIGKDTRLSSYMIESALASGFLSAGMNVVYLGPVPTPAVSMFIRSLRADLGVMISASHNPPGDNGIKFFNSDGYKLCDEKEAQVEALIDSPPSSILVPASELGRARRLEDSQGRYVEYAKNTFPRGLRLDGLKIVIDCAHGATYKIAPKVLWELGAEIIPIGVDPNGSNINLGCGATSTEALRAKVIEKNAHVGIALDGDGDRVIIVDEYGQVINGDALLALIALYWREKEILDADVVVGTVMSNLGLERFLEGLGIKLLRTNVGDRYVVEAMRQHDYKIGGEQSGHIILSDYVSTGDGLITALQFLAIMREKKLPASVVGRPFVPVPQVLKNVAIASPEKMMELAAFKAAIEDEVQKLGSKGRILVRKSGTEPLIRIMVEGDDEVYITRVANDLAQKIQDLAG